MLRTKLPTEDVLLTHPPGLAPLRWSWMASCFPPLSPRTLHKDHPKGRWSHTLVPQPSEPKGRLWFRRLFCVSKAEVREVQKRRFQLVTKEAWQGLGTWIQDQPPQEEVSSPLPEVCKQKLDGPLARTPQRGLGIPLGRPGGCPLRKHCPTWGSVRCVPTLAPGLKPTSDCGPRPFSICHWLFLLTPTGPLSH